MRILHTISGLRAKSGGTSTCTYDLMVALNHVGCDAELLTVGGTSSTDVIMGEGEEWIKVVSNDCVSPYGYSRNIKQYLNDTEYDIYHANGLWMHCNHVTCVEARKKGKPYIITPHGMLYPNALRRSYWKKLPLLKLCFNKDIMHATCLHATCMQEKDNIRAFGYRGPVAVIGNPANIPSYINELKGRDTERQVSTFGFLGRLHPVKGIERILYGLSLCAPEKRKRMRLVIMGKGDERYEQFLRDEVKRLDLKENVELCGFVSGRDKFERLAVLDALFVPSDFENFGMIVTEALACKTPVFASLGTPWQELNERECGWWMERTPENIAQVMLQVCDMPTVELNAMGERGRQLVEEKYTAKSVALQMQQLYRWIIKGGDKPEFIYENI